MADRFASWGYSLNKQTRWSNDQTIIELGYRKISWFGWGKLLICETLTNHDILLNLVQWLLIIYTDGGLSMRYPDYLRKWEEGEGVAFSKKALVFYFCLGSGPLFGEGPLLEQRRLYEMSYTTLLFFLSAINFLFICMHRIPNIYGFKWLSNLDHTNIANVPLSLVFI